MNEILLYFAIKYEGRWDEIYKALDRKEVVDKDLVARTYKEYKGNFVTILMDNYPEKFKYIKKPPFVLFYKGELSNIDKKVTGIIYNSYLELKDIKAKINDGLICDSKENMFDNKIIVRCSNLDKAKDGSLTISEVPSGCKRRLTNWHRMFEGVADRLLIVSKKEARDHFMIEKLFKYYSKPIHEGKELERYLNEEILYNKG